jgi:Protein of unknown function (DUF3052)
MAGYSAAPLVKKLGIKAGFNVVLIDPPENYFELLEELPAGAKVTKDEKSKVDFIHFFVKKGKELEKQLPILMKKITPDGMIWVSWYKKSSGIATDVTEDHIRNTALALGLVDIKVCAIDDTWSGLKLVIRKELRTNR